MKLNVNMELLDEVFFEEESGENADYILNAHFFQLTKEKRAEAKLFIEKGMEPSLSFRKAVIPLLSQEEKEAFAEVQVGYGFDEIKCLWVQDYRDDPYYKAICKETFKNKKIGDWTLEMKSYEPYELFVYDEVRPILDAAKNSYSPVGFFKEKFPFPALSKGDTVYMSLIPHEINTMAGPIEKAHGNVVTLGLGMGYFTFMAANKEEVNSVTVLERDQEVIDLFKSTFLPLFPHPEKVTIIRIDDALKHQPLNPFDYAFADLHHDAKDGLPLYISLLKKEGFAKEMDVWIEKALLAYFRRFVIALLQEECEGYEDGDYVKNGEFENDLYYALHHHLKNYVIDNEADIAKLLEDDTLRNILRDLKI